MRAPAPPSFGRLRSLRYSYKYIEASIRNGVLEELADHAVGPPEGVVRGVGSTTRPPKGTRNKYTSSDDKLLWDWVNTNPQKGGGTDGNEIYKQLEAKVNGAEAMTITRTDFTQHPHHPWQSWRDRYIKHVKFMPQPLLPPPNAPPTPPKDQHASHDLADKQLKRSKHGASPFTEEDTQALLKVGAQIMEMDPGLLTDAWEAWTRDFDVSGKVSPAIRHLLTVESRSLKATVLQDIGRNSGS